MHTTSVQCAPTMFDGVVPLCPSRWVQPARGSGRGCPNEIVDECGRTCHHARVLVAGFLSSVRRIYCATIVIVRPDTNASSRRST